MAIIKNSLLGNASKSISNVTFRNVNGQTIASQRIYTNNSKSGKQLSRRSSFKRMSQLGALLRPILEIGFPAKNGSRPHTSFIKWNKTLGDYFATHPSHSEHDSVVYDLYVALSDPLFFGQVLSASGNLHTKGFFKVNDEQLPEGALALSCDYEEGDVVVLGVYTIYDYRNDKGARINVFNKTMNRQMMQSLDHSNILKINTETIPELRRCTPIFPGATLIGHVLTGVMLRGNERSTATFTAISPE